MIVLFGEILKEWRGKHFRIGTVYRPIEFGEVKKEVTRCITGLPSP
jgi:hypothetical protein